MSEEHSDAPLTRRVVVQYEKNKASENGDEKKLRQWYQNPTSVGIVTAVVAAIVPLRVSW